MLLAARDRRAKPARDDKLMTDWNGLAIRSLARAGAAFERPDWVQAAIAAYDYVRKVSGEGDRLYHNFEGGKRGEDSGWEKYRVSDSFEPSAIIHLPSSLQAGVWPPLA